MAGCDHTCMACAMNKTLSNFAQAFKPMVRKVQKLMISEGLAPTLGRSIDIDSDWRVPNMD